MLVEVHTFCLFGTQSGNFILLLSALVQALYLQLLQGMLQLCDRNLNPGLLHCDFG